LVLGEFRLDGWLFGLQPGQDAVELLARVFLLAECYEM